MHRHAIVAITLAITCTTFAADAVAACISDTTSPLPSVSRPSRLVQHPAALTRANAVPAVFNSIVGMWSSTFYVGDGPGVYDQGFQQWHSDHTEIMVDNAVSPAFGNVCVGVWTLVAPRTYKLKHMTFNWNADGTPAGTFVLTMTVVLDRQGRAFNGTYAADSFDLAGTVIPELHAEGAVRGTRITVD
jgi:hypothetical protein